MRIDQLELTRYGKFTALPIAMPQAKRDFHLIVGPNEAGKSTIRDAILDLLFGIETRSSYDFLHPKAEMCLGAKISHSGASLKFQRVKKTKSSLIDSKGAALADNSLAAFLGTADRAFFDQMFGLDHDRLVTGGNEILKASNDIGRILFQSAAGIGSLGTVRDALEEEANKLWARRRSGDRAYYIAADDFATAEAALKRATVKTKDWTEARDKVQAIEQLLAEVRTKFETLERERMRLERIRRVAPALRACTDNSEQLAAMGEVAVLPANAAKLLGDTESELAVAKAQQDISLKLADEARAKRNAIEINVDVIRGADAIESLAERRQQTTFHERDIGKRELEIDGLWKSVQAAMRQLGWVLTNEEALDAKLPPLPTRRTISSLINQRGALERALTAASEAERAKRREIADNESELERISILAVSPELRASLDAALRLGDHPTAITRERNKVARAQREFRAAEASLGEWRLDLVDLRQLVLPPADVAKKLRSDYDQLQLDHGKWDAKRVDLVGEIATLELEISQYKASRQAVTAEDLATARQSRDGLWTTIKNGARSLSDAANDYEERVRDTDGLADKRHDKTKEAAELQSRIDNLARLQVSLEDTEQRLAKVQSQVATIEADWQSRATALGFPSMPLLALDQWQTALPKLFAAADAVELAEVDAAQLQESFAAAMARLRVALGAAGAPVANDAEIDVLVATGNAFVEAASGAKARREELSRQIANARTALADLAQKAIAANSELGKWKDSWALTMTQAGLVNVEIAAAEGALLLFDEIDDKLKSIREIRKARIEMMRRDLEDLARQARTLVESLAPERNEESPADISAELSARLAKAREDKTEADRLDAEVKRFESQIAEAQNRIEIALARIAPLIKLAGTDDTDALRVLIARSDEHRGLKCAADAGKSAAEANGDGLAMKQLEEETIGIDIAQIPVRLGEISRDLAEARDIQAERSANQATASAELGKISGSDEAARAESARQDALSRMGDAAERFIKVHIAGKLLRWAIDRFRETKQGPMLARASEIFSGLTLGSFSKLVVDFESDPPRLDGLRPDGRTVGIAGMSDGTRDQLYLALRLAALEMHIGQGHALPFIADDLFINYDDERSRAGLEALAKLSEVTQVIFLSHHRHLLPAVKRVFGDSATITELALQ
ncbi:MAG TPA: AAA family ATPase [Accumulibacter sp.]|nr:AAA family ATPase [Accumulibacter sp.]